MEKGPVYKATTEPAAKAPRRCPLGCTLRRLWGWRLLVKALQVILSLVAVVCEEIVEDCNPCSGLYLFEFISCSAFLLSILILCAYCTNLYESLGKDKVKKLNFWAVPVIAASFLLASIVFSATCSGSAVENTACVFGFCASCAFAAECGVELFHKRKQKVDFAALFRVEFFRRRKRNVDRRPENPRNPRNIPSATESRPLNKE